MKTKTFTCIVCPRGCELNITLDDLDKIVDITGNACKRGKEYAQNECTDPKRMLTTTVRIAGGGVIPVKTSSAAIPKSEIFNAMAKISQLVAPKDAKIGDVLVKNFMGFGADLLITGKK